MKNLLGHPVSYWTVCKIDSHQKMFKNRWNNSFAESGSACIIDLGWICIPIPNAEFLGIFQSSKKGLTQGIERIQIQLLLFSNHVFCYSIVIQITSGRFSMHFSNRNLLWRSHVIQNHIVWKFRKMSHFSILSFLKKFCAIKSDLFGNNVWHYFLGFRKFAKLTVFGIFHLSGNTIWLQASVF